MQNLQQFIRDVHEPQLSQSERVKLHVAVNHLRRVVDRDPKLSDLDRATLTRVLDSLTTMGRRPGTLKAVKTSFNKLSQAARNAGLIRDVPTLPPVRLCKQPVTPPWPLPELNRLLASARTVDGEVCGIPFRFWMSALLMLLLDTGCSRRAAFGLKLTDYNPRRGTLLIGEELHTLHRLTAAALDLIRWPERPELFPWAYDQQGRRPPTILYRRMRHVLHRANLPHVSANLFDRLRITHNADAEIMDHIDVNIPFRPVPGKPRLANSWDRKRKAEPSENQPIKNRGRWKAPEFYRLQPLDDSRTLRKFFEETYRPLRLARAAKSTIKDYRKTINRFGWFLASEPTFANLNDETLERFMAWLYAKPSSEATVNGYRACLLALWNYAWKKRKVDELPRDVPKYRESKRLPECWSLDELERILNAAEETEGDIAGIPAGKFWPALILTLYDTGVRIDAIMHATTSNFRSPWLTIPAEDQKQDADQAFELHPDTLAAIAATEPGGREMLFPWPWSLNGRHTRTDRYREILERAGLPHGKRDLFHKLRRTHATYLAAATDDATAQRSLGHSSLQVTARYIDPRKMKRAPAAQVMERPRLRVVGDDSLPAVG